MVDFIFKNILRFVLLMFAVSFVVFALVSLSPIDPIQANLGQAAYVRRREIGSSVSFAARNRTALRLQATRQCGMRGKDTRTISSVPATGD